MASNPRFTENHELGHAMRGVDFPARRDALLEKAKQNGASDDAVRRLERLPDTDYSNVAEVMAAASEG